MTIKRSIGSYEWIINENSFPLEMLERIDEGIEKGSLIKESAIRKVIKLTPPSSPPSEGGEGRGGIFIKIYKKRGILRRLKSSLFKSKAFKEWEKIKKLSSLDISTSYPLAFGQKKNSFFLEEEYLITRAVDNAIPLNEYLSKVRSGICGVHLIPTVIRINKDRQSSIVNRQFLIRVFSQFIGDIHKKGILNKDFHTGNILINVYNKLEPCFYLVDVDKISFRRRISFRKAIKNLITLNLCFLNTVTRAHRLRFLKDYFRVAWPEKSQEYKIWAIKIECESKKLQRRHWKKRDKKCFQEGSTILPIKFRKGYIRREFKYPEVERILQDPNHTFKEAEVVKDSRSTKLVELNIKRGEQETKIIFKKYNFQWDMDLLKGFFRKSKAFKAWRGANALLRRGVPTPLPIAVLERRKIGFLLESFLITEKVEKTQGALQFVQNNFRSGLSKEAIKIKRLFLKEMASFVAHLHNMGIYSGDLKGNNILVIPPNPPLVKGGKGGFSEEKEGFQFFLVDLDELKIERNFPPSLGILSKEARKRLRNLTQLNKSFRETYLISRADRMRFLLEYLSSLDIDRNLYKWYWRRISEKSEKRLRKTGKQWERIFS